MAKAKVSIDPPAETENEAEQETTAEQPAADPPEAGSMRIKFRLPNNGAKVFTSKGPKLHGAVCELPEAEAQGYCALDLAHPTDKELEPGPAALLYVDDPHD